MTPLRSQMIHDMHLQRLAPRTPHADVEALKGLARFYHCSPDRLEPRHLQTYLHHLLVERGLAWSSCIQVACGLKFFYTKTLSWTDVELTLPHVLLDGLCPMSSASSNWSACSLMPRLPKTVPSS